MFDFAGYSCMNATWSAITATLDTLFWVWLGYLLFRVRNLKRALSAKTAPPPAASATRRDDGRGGQTWDIGPTAPARSPRAPGQREG